MTRGDIWWCYICDSCAQSEPCKDEVQFCMCDGEKRSKIAAPTDADFSSLCGQYADREETCQKRASEKLQHPADSEEKYPLGTAIIASGEELLLKNR